jgi:aminopeptidase 2
MYAPVRTARHHADPPSLDVVEDSTSISVNTNELKIHSTTITAGDEVISSDPKLTNDEEKQRTQVDFSQTLPGGSKAKLTMTFTGTLNDDMAGFYRSSSKAADGSDTWMATTQMEPTDARRAFPCFDEPALKAKFTVTLVADDKMTCLSNMDVASEKQVDSKIISGKRKAVTFHPTPLMSTYLLAFIVGELNYIETNEFRLPIRVYAPKGNDIEHGRFSLDLAAKTLKFYEETFDSEFPLPKMDMVAIPDFSAGAMENWGLITYRVVDVLIDEKNSSATTKQRVAETVQHELAHQWFGNLVTMDFWEGLWLNEGFATWMSWYSCNVFYPDWKVWEGYVTDTLAGALSLDALRSSHPIEVPIKRADEINQIFDAISYSKGSSIIRMISKYLGEDVFMEGIRRYLKKHAYGNTQTGDLWAALSDASGKDVEKVMDIWTKKVGFPVVSVTENADSIHLKPEEDETLYPVFLALRTKDGVNEDATLFEREKNLKLKDTEFFKLNADHSGFYRTSYTPERLEKLGVAAKQGLLSVEDRAGMIADAGSLAASGYQKTSGILSLLDSFKQESEFVVWSEIITRIATLRGAWMFEDQEVKDALKAFQRNLCSEKAHELGWTFTDNDGHIEQQFKAMMFGAAGTGDEVVEKAAFDMFEKFKAGDRKALHPNLRGSVYAIVLDKGGKAEYDVVENEAVSAETSTERNTALRALGRAKSPELIQRTLNLCMSKDVKTQDIYLPLSGLRGHAEGCDALWKFTKDNWDELVRRLPISLPLLSSVVAIATSSFTHREHIEDIKAFFKDKETKGFDMSLSQALDSVSAKAAWLERDSEDVKAWLKEHKYL